MNYFLFTDGTVSNLNQDGYDTRRVYDLTDTDMKTIFYSQVAPVSDPNRDGYVTCIFSYLRVTRRIPNTLLPL
jgi:hypothetical protein